MADKLFSIGKKLVPIKFKKYFSKAYYPLNNLMVHGTTDFFRAIEIETLTKCNRKCFYCPNSKYDRGEKYDYMPESIFKKLIDELAELNYNGRISPHFYGEPLLDNRLPELLGYARRKLPNAYIVIYTNGDFLTKEVFDTLINKGVDQFLVTKHVGPMNNVVETTLNQLSQTEKKRITLRHFNIETPLSNRGGLVKPKNVVGLKVCKFPATTVVVDYEGNLILCCNDYSSSIKFGNIRNEKLMNIWKKYSYKTLRKNLLVGKFDLDICKICANPCA